MADKPVPKATLKTGMITPGEMLQADMRRRYEQLRKDLLPIMYDAQQSIDEAAFITYFLPLFAGEYGQDKAKYEEALAAWYRVSGNPYTSVNVTKNGQVVALVPPIRSNFLTGRPKESNKDMGSIIEDVAQHATLNPSAAQAMLITALHQRYLTNIPRPDLTQDQKAWFDLLNRYGKAPSSMMALNKSATGQSTASDTDDDDFEF